MRFRRLGRGVLVGLGFFAPSMVGCGGDDDRPRVIPDFDSGVADAREVSVEVTVPVDAGFSPDVPVSPRDVGAVLDVSGVEGGPVADGGGTLCPSGSVRIAGGDFSMGDPLGDNPRAEPVRMVQVSPFCIDLREVSVADYRACVSAGRCTAAGPGEACNGSAPGRDAHPINCVDWSQAEAYCQWRGAVLPTEAQWEFAARGPGERLFSWGNASPASRPCWSGAMRRTGTCARGSAPMDVTPEGVSDLMGNVAEWVADWFAPYDPTERRDPMGPMRGDERAIRGGSWRDMAAFSLRAMTRRSAPPNRGSAEVGFRCAAAPR